MRVTVIGVGDMGGSIARGLAAAGIETVVTFSRHPEKAAAVAEEIGRNCVALPPSEAVVGSDAVVLAVSPDGMEDAVAAVGGLAGQIVICVTSGLALDPSGGTYGLPTERSSAIAQQVAELAPQARVVQSLSTTFGAVLADRSTGVTGTPTLGMCGDDAQAKSVAAEVISHLGAEAVDLGGLALAPALETFATASAQLAIAARLAPTFAVRFLTAS